MANSLQDDVTLHLRIVKLHGEVATALPGLRAYTLFRAARDLGTYVYDGRLPAHIAEDSLDHAAGCCGLLFTDGQEKVDAIIAAAIEHAQHDFAWNIE